MRQVVVDIVGRNSAGDRKWKLTQCVLHRSDLFKAGCVPGARTAGGNNILAPGKAGR